jgi:hypothetical protein
VKRKTKAAKRNADPLVAIAVELIVESGLSDPWVHASLKAQGVSNANRRKAILRRAHAAIAVDDQPETPHVRRARIRAAIAVAYEQKDWPRAERLQRELAELVEPPVKPLTGHSPDEIQAVISSALSARLAGRITQRQYADALKAAAAATQLIYAEAATKAKLEAEAEDDAGDVLELSIAEISAMIQAESRR